ncbi:MAG: (d)CMP kinase [Rhodospirillaceae bacterium]|nr:(d)CMP kinase [Rhodospirillaceae bacterium]
MSDPPSESVSPLPLVIAVDGPAAAGKGTLARRLAEALDLAHLDSGALYRAVGLAVLRAGGDPADEAAAVAAAASLDTGRLSDPALRAPETGDAASRVAAFPSVRAALLDFQRRFARNPPAGRRGAAIDGRDIGTVVVPDAPVKIFVTASPDERARRRFAELRAAGADVIYPAVLSELEARDGRDSSRAVAPLKPADDAAILDTSTLDAEAAFRAALDIVAQRAPGWRRLVQDVR